MANELETQVNQLRTELDALKEALTRTFCAIGSGAEWYQAKPQTRVEGTNEVASIAAPPAPTSVYSATEIRGLIQEFFPNGVPTMDEIKKLIEKE